KLAQLRELAKTNDLALFCLVRYLENYGEDEGKGFARAPSFQAIADLLKRLPGNTYVPDQSAQLCLHYRYPQADMAKAIEAALKAHPNCYLLHVAEGTLQIAAAHYEAAVPAMEQAVKCSVRNPMAWSGLYEAMKWLDRDIR